MVNIQLFMGILVCTSQKMLLLELEIFFIVLAESILIRYAVIYKPILPLIKMQFYV